MELLCINNKDKETGHYLPVEAHHGMDSANRHLLVFAATSYASTINNVFKKAMMASVPGFESRFCLGSRFNILILFRFPDEAVSNLRQKRNERMWPGSRS